MKTYATGAFPSPPDDGTTTIPPAIDQGYISNCTAISLCYGLKSAHGLDFDPNWLMAINTRPNASIPGILEALMIYGALPAGDYSIDPTWTVQAREWAEKYKSKLLPIAAKYKIAEYKQITTEDALKAALADGWYVAFSANCKTRMIGADGIYRPYSGSDYGLVHAMSAWRVTPDGTIRILNSWGTSWGDQGQANMTAADILRGGDCWAYRIDTPAKKDGEELRVNIISAVPGGKKVKIRAKPDTGSAVIGYLRAIDDGVLLSKNGNWCEVAIAQTADQTVVGWVQSKYIKEV